MNLEIANRLVELRKSRGYSQEELAAQLGVSRQAVSKWERAESSPDTDNLIALARLYGLSLDALLLWDNGQTGAAAQTCPRPEELDKEAEEEAEIFAAAQEWDRAEFQWQQERQKAFRKKKEKLLMLLTLALMVLLPLAVHLFGLGAAYPLVITVVYLVLGFLLDNWHPGWMLFLTIPLYYILF